MYDTSHRVVSSLTEQVRVQLHAYRAEGGTDEEYLEGFIAAFVANARQQPGPALLVHTAIGVYALALATDEIVRLNGVVAMYESVLAVITES